VGLKPTVGSQPLPDSAENETHNRSDSPAYQRWRQRFGSERSSDLCTHDGTEGTCRAANDRGQSATL